MIAKTPPMQRASVEPPSIGKGIEIQLKLYVANATPNSQRAKANLESALQSLTGTAGYRLEIIDVLADGRRAVTDSVIVTPTLIAIGPKQRVAIVGDLCDAGKLHGFLKSAADISE